MIDLAAIRERLSQRERDERPGILAELVFGLLLCAASVAAIAFLAALIADLLGVQETHAYTLGSAVAIVAVATWIALFPTQRWKTFRKLIATVTVSASPISHNAEDALVSDSLQALASMRADAGVHKTDMRYLMRLDAQKYSLLLTLGPTLLRQGIEALLIQRQRRRFLDDPHTRQFLDWCGKDRRAFGHSVLLGHLREHPEQMRGYYLAKELRLLGKQHLEFEPGYFLVPEYVGQSR